MNDKVILKKDLIDNKSLDELYTFQLDIREVQLEKPFTLQATGYLSKAELRLEQLVEENKLPKSFLSKIDRLNGKLYSEKIQLFKSEYRPALDIFTKESILPEKVITNDATDVLFNVYSNVKSVENIHLQQTDANGLIQTDRGNLYDDATHGDKIAQDSWYSKTISINESTPKNLYFVATANYNNENIRSKVISINIVKIPQKEEVEKITNVLDEASDKYKELVKSGIDKNQAQEKIKQWLLSQNTISSVEIGEGGIGIIDINGLLSGIDTSPANISTFSFLHNFSIPNFSLLFKEAYAIDNQITFPQNNQAYVLEPFYSDLARFGDKLTPLFQSKGWHPFYFKDADVSVARLRNMSMFGVIYIHTHGGDRGKLGLSFSSGEKAIIPYADNSIGRDWVNQRIIRVRPIDKNDYYWGIRKGFIDFYSKERGTYPNSLVVINACHGFETSEFADVFRSNGVSTYVGWKGVVWSDVGGRASEQFFKALLNEKKLTGEAFLDIKDKKDPKTGAEIQKSGSDFLSLTALETPTPTPPQPTNNIVKNGSFEVPVVRDITLDTYYAGQTFGDWTVESGSVDHISRYYWQAADGLQSVDLSGTSDGIIFQDLNTNVGKEYAISFALSGNPEGGPSIKRLEVWWGSSLLDTLSFDVTGKSNSSMGWEYHTYTATATSNATRLRFKSLMSGLYGPAIDSISVQLSSTSN